MKRHLLVSLAFLSVLMTFNACKKEITKEEDNPGRNLSALAREYQFNNWPRVENDMLSFENPDHFHEYLNFLNETITVSEDENGEDRENDPHVILREIEERLGFVSAREVSEEAWDRQSEIGWNTLEEIPEKHFINSTAILSILNRNNDVKVGDRIAHYISDDYGAEIPAERRDLLEKLHDVRGEAGVEDFVTLDTAIKLIFLNIAELDQTIQAKTTSDGYLLNYPSVVSPDLCSNPTKIRLEGMYLIYLDVSAAYSTPVQGYYLINWGDGTSSTHISNAGLNSSVVTDAEHTYPAIGKYTLTIYASTSPGVSPSVNNASYSTTIKVPTSSCNFGVSKETGWNWNYVPHDSYQRAWAGKCWVKMYRNILGKDFHSTGASTEVFRKEKGKWKRNRTDQVGAYYDMVKYDKQCSTNWGSGGGTYPSNAKDATKCHDDNGYFGWKSLYAEHKIRIGLDWYTYTQTINPCR